MQRPCTCRNNSGDRKKRRWPSHWTALPTFFAEPTSPSKRMKWLPEHVRFVRTRSTRSTHIVSVGPITFAHTTAELGQVFSFQIGEVRIRLRLILAELRHDGIFAGRIVSYESRKVSRILHKILSGFGLESVFDASLRGSFFAVLMV